jgi:hypothetical protein
MYAVKMVQYYYMNIVLMGGKVITAGWALITAGSHTHHQRFVNGQ